MSDTPPPRSHNQPPELTEPAALYDPAGLPELLRADWGHLVLSVQGLLEGIERFKAAYGPGLLGTPLTTDEEAGKAGDFYKQLSDMADHIEAVRKKVKAPLAEAVKAVDDYFIRGLVEPLQAGAKHIHDTLDEYPPSADNKLRGAYCTISWSEKWIAEIVEPNEVPRQYCAPVQKLVDTAMEASRINKGPPTVSIPGVRFYQDLKVRVR